MYRHGENLLKPVEKAEGKVSRHKLYVVGHSETGHHHVLESKTEFEVIEGEKEELYVRLFEPGKVVHQKTFDTHRTLDIPAGTYEVVRKKEYDPFQEVVRAVWD
jgi:hypothetical protein